MIADMVEDGHHLVICHGNGPQVGMIQLSMDYAAASDAISADVALPECGAMSQGYIGYHLQNGITNELNVRGIDRPVAAVLTRVVVNAKDPHFRIPPSQSALFIPGKRRKDCPHRAIPHLWRIQAVDTDGWWRHRFLWKSRRCRLSAG